MINAVCNRESETITSLEVVLYFQIPNTYTGTTSHRKLLTSSSPKDKLITTDNPCYKYEPQPVLEKESTKIYWDRPVITDRTILAN